MEHSTLSVAEKEQVKLAWDKTILTDMRLENNNHDITCVQNSSHEWILIDVAVPKDKNLVIEQQADI